MVSSKAGLQDVVVASSSICYIDGQKGILSYRGIDIHDLAEKSNFEEVCFSVWALCIQWRIVVNLKILVPYIGAKYPEEYNCTYPGIWPKS